MKSRFKYIICTFFALLCFLYLFLKNNPSFYGNLGNYFYSKNDIQRAQNYFEKSFLLGNTNPKFREMYVNLLINSPLTIESQEKLVRIADGSIKDSAEESAKHFLYNLKREIHNKYPNNYIKQSPYNGQIMHWGRLPITYTFKNTSKIPKELIAEVDNAFNEWERASSCRIRFERVNGLRADIVVIFEKNNYDNPEYGKKYVIAYTTPNITANTLKTMEIRFNITDPDGGEFTKNQIYNTALHEIFHALGFMGHSYDKNNVMFMSKENDIMINDTRIKLNESDKITLELLYKIKPDITNDNQLKYLYIPYLILGGEEEVNEEKNYEAKNYIRNAPNVSAGYIDMAQTLVNQKRYYLAIGYLEKALRLAVNDETRNIVFYNLAVANFYDGNYELALIYLDKAEEIKDSDDLHLLRAEIYLKQDLTIKAKEEFEYLISQNPQNIDLSIKLANINIKERHYLKARKILKNYLKHNPKDKKNPKLKSYKILFL